MYNYQVLIVYNTWLYSCRASKLRSYYKITENVYVHPHNPHNPDSLFPVAICGVSSYLATESFMTTEVILYNL